MGADLSWGKLLPPRSTAFGAGVVLGAVLLGVVVIQGVLGFPFDPEPSLLRKGFAVGAIILFFLGALGVILFGPLARRLVSSQVMAGGVAILVISLRGDEGAWILAVMGWGVAACMCLWGVTLAGAIGSGGGEEERR